ncbi:MAG: hypothetical protein V4519_02900 [Patescibacteria group bacterium]
MFWIHLGYAVKKTFVYWMLFFFGAWMLNKTMQGSVITAILVIYAIALAVVTFACMVFHTNAHRRLVYKIDNELAEPGSVATEEQLFHCLLMKDKTLKKRRFKRAMETALHHGLIRPDHMKIPGTDTVIIRYKRLKSQRPRVSRSIVDRTMVDTLDKHS